MDYKEYEYRILKNCVAMMTKTYRKHTANWVIVRDFLLAGTSTSGSTSCIQKCIDLGIDPYGITLERKK